MYDKMESLTVMILLTLPVITEIRFQGNTRSTCGRVPQTAKRYYSVGRRLD